MVRAACEGMSRAVECGPLPTVEKWATRPAAAPVEKMDPPFYRSFPLDGQFRARQIGPE